MSVSESEKRTRNVKLNILWSVVLKAFGVIISFALLPMTVHYLSEVEYGIWVTLFTIMNWVNFLDMGIGLGLRNKLAEAVSRNDSGEIRTYISTGFAVILMIGVILFTIFLVGIQYVDFQVLFNTVALDNKELYQVTLYTGVFVIITFVLSIINQVYYAYQKAAITGAIQIIHNLIMLGIVFWLIGQQQHKLVYFVFSFGIATILSKTVFISLFFVKKREIIPRFKYIDLKKIKSISSLGIKFFVMQIACILGFSSSNIIITQLLGPEHVRSYDVVFKIFSVIPMVHNLIVTPLWSAYTDAYAKGDIEWIKKSLYKLNMLMIPITICTAVLSWNIDIIIGVWIGGIPVTYNKLLILAMFIYIIIYVWNANFAVLMNGIGKVNVQMIGWVIGASLIIPLSIVFVRFFNMQSEGIMLAMLCCLMINAVIVPINAYKILNTYNKSKEKV